MRSQSKSCRRKWLTSLGKGSVLGSEGKSLTKELSQFRSSSSRFFFWIRLWFLNSWVTESSNGADNPFSVESIIILQHLTGYKWNFLMPPPRRMSEFGYNDNRRGKQILLVVNSTIIFLFFLIKSSLGWVGGSTQTRILLFIFIFIFICCIPFSYFSPHSILWCVVSLYFIFVAHNSTRNLLLFILSKIIHNQTN